MKNLSRRTCLKGAGVLLALPYLNAMADSKKEKSIQRLAVIALPFGVVQNKFHPKDSGFNYTMSETLKPIEHLRDDFTVFSQLEHDVRGGHQANHAFLSGVLSTTRAAYPEGNMTLDQAIAEKNGYLTRFPTLNFGEAKYSFTRTGVSVPTLKTPSQAFKMMFIDQSEAEKKSIQKALANSESVLDAVRADAKSLQKRLGKEDREKLDDYFTSIRGTEKKFNMSKSWLNKPKPKVDMKKYTDIASGSYDKLPANELLKAWLELTWLAFQTDSSRIVVSGFGNCTFQLDGVKDSYHTCSHHGLKPVYLDQLAITEQFVAAEYGKFVQRLKDTKLPNSESMLESTQVLLGSGMGSGSRHTNTNPPIVLAGGRYKHGQHINAETKQPLCSLYLSMMQHALGKNVERFSVSQGPLKGLDLKA